MAKIHTMDELFQHELEDLLSAEQQLVEALPKMAEAAGGAAAAADGSDGSPVIDTLVISVSHTTNTAAAEIQMSATLKIAK